MANEQINIIHTKERKTEMEKRTIINKLEDLKSKLEEPCKTELGGIIFDLRYTISQMIVIESKEADKIG